MGELDAEVARIDELIAGKATIEDLTATNAEITNLKAKDAEIENLVATKATIEDLTATNATIEILDAEVADINTLVNGNLTSDNILSFNITSQNTTMENAFIKDAMIDTVTANKIMSGTIDTNNVTIQSTDGSMLLQGTLLQMKDDNGKVRIQIGKDTGGNFTFILYDESGTGVLIDEEGIKSSDAIADGLIVDAKVADNANIAGSKLDIASVITEVNNDNSTTIKSNKIYLNEQKQTLEVAFNKMVTTTTELEESVTSNTTQINAANGNINTLISENTSRKEEIKNLDGEIESVNSTLSSKYSSLEQDLDGFKTTVSATYTTKDEFGTLTNRVSSAESKLTKDSLTTTIGSYYTTSSDVDTKLDNYATKSSVEQTASSLTATFTSMHDGGYSQGITTINKDGINVSQTNYNGWTSITASGFYVNNGSENVISCTTSGLVVKGNVTATSGKIANFTISGNDLIGSSVGMGGASGTNQAFWAGSNTSASAPFRVGHDGALTATKATIAGGSIDIGGNFSVNSSGMLTTNSQIYAQGGIYTYQDIRGLDDTYKTGGLTLVSGTGNVAVRTEAVAHSVYIQPASGEAYVTYPSSPDLADLRLKNLFSNQTNASLGNFGVAQLYATNAYLEFMYGLGIIRVAEANHLYLQCGSAVGNTSTEVRCTCYKDPNSYTNIRAYNVCAQNAVYANGVNVSSDRERKRDIELYETDALHEICTTPVYTYHLDTDLDEEVKRIGIIMQEAPLDAVDISGKGVDLYQMVTMLWKAVQQQQEMINELKGE